MPEHDKNEPSALIRAADSLGNHGLRDHVHNALNAALNQVPLVGGALASLWDDYIPQSRANRLVAFTRRLAEALDGVSERIAEQAEAYVRSDEFTFLWEEAYRGVARSYQQEKLDAYRGILVNALLQPDLRQEWQEYFLQLVDTLTPLHLLFLRACYDKEGFAAARGLQLPQTASSPFHYIQPIFPELTRPQIDVIAGDLGRRGLLAESWLHTMMTARGAANLRAALTDLGRSFVEFITSPGELSADAGDHS